MSNLTRSLTYKVYPLEKGKEKKKCKKWQIQVQLPKEVKDGKDVYPKKRKTFNGTFRQAEVAAEEFREQLEADIFYQNADVDRNCLLSTYCSEFYQVKMDREELQKGSLQKIKAALECLILNHADVPLNQVTTASISKAFMKLREGNTLSGKKLAPATAQGYLVFWKSLFEYAVNDGYIDVNPAKKIRPIKIPKSQKKALSLEEAHDLYAKLDPTKNWEIGTIVSLYCGLRQSEVLNLQWKDVDFDKQILRVKKSKTDAGVREVPMVKEVIESLNIRKQYLKGKIEVYNKRQSNKTTCLSFSDDYYVCSGVLGSRKAGTTALSQWWYVNKWRFGYEDITFHELRHTFATFLAKANVHPSVMQKLLGHSSSRISLEIYTHVHQEDLLDARNRLQEIIV